jgi:6-hydroxycyclohex-1-ene-1-carbonyl-CoA dehydrogenase
MKSIASWKMVEVGEPMQISRSDVPMLAGDEVLVRVAGCGVCHTDLGFFYDGVRTAKPLPLTLGHEISGIVEETGDDAAAWLKKAVIIPAVMPCGTCALCRRGLVRICRQQKMPGNHIEGGFASHVVVPSKYLCPVDVRDETSSFGESGLTLRELSVVADAVTTPFQAVRNSGLVSGDVAIFVGAGGVGGYGIQIANALGANVVAIDVDDKKLETYARFGAKLTLNPIKMGTKEIRKTIQTWVQTNQFSQFEWKIFETSGTAKGQELAFTLLTFAATLSVVGFTMDAVSLRLSNLMAFDAKAIGNWGCDPVLYPEALEWVRRGTIQLAPFVQTFPMSEINSIFDRAHRKEIDQRPILIPDP